MAEYVVSPGGYAASTLSKAKSIAKKVAKQDGYAKVENIKTEKVVFQVRASNPSPVTARKTKGGIIVSAKVATLAAAKKLAKKMGVR